MSDCSTPEVATPILDSATLPKRKTKRSLGSMLLGLVAAAPFAVILGAASDKARETRNSAGDYILSTYFLTILLAILIHELGHLIVGYLVGFKFDSINIGPFSLHVEYGRLRFSLRQTMPASGYAGMHIDRIRRMRRRLLLFSLGGPSANLLTAAIAFLLAYFTRPGAWLSMLWDMFWMISIFFGIANLLPLRVRGLYADGARIYMLLRWREKSRRWMSVAGIGYQARSGVRARDFRRSWLCAATVVRDNSVDEFSANWMAYASANDRKDALVAASCLERCLTLTPSFGPSLRDLVAVEASVFTAWFRQDAACAERWLSQVKKVKRLSKLIQIRSDIAISCARNEFVYALSRWKEAYAFIEALPGTPQKERLREGFLEWREEIQDRQLSTSAISESLSPG